MSTGWKVVSGIGAGLAALLIIGAMSVVGIWNTAKNHETDIAAQYKQDQNNYDKFWKSITEQAQIKASYAKDLKELYTSTTESRYGKGGSKAVFQFIKEHNPTLDASVYKQLMSSIEGGRIDFEAQQKSLIDRKRVYEREILNPAVTGLIAHTMGFPKIDLKQFDIITSEETEQAFASKKAAPLKIN